MAAINAQKFANELEKGSGKTGGIETAAKKAIPKKPKKKKDRASLIKMIGEKLSKLVPDPKMVYHGKGYHAAKTGKDPEKVEREAAKKAEKVRIETDRTKAIKRLVTSSSGVDWEKDKPSVRITRRNK